MSGINGISANLLKYYVTFQSKKDMTLEDMFRMLSFEMGGDGSSITKDQLDSYIDKAEAGDIDVSKSKLRTLKTIQNNWDTISGGDDSISFEDMKKYAILLLGAMVDGGSSEDSEAEASDAEINSYLLTKRALEISDDDEDRASKLSSILKETLSGITDENDDANADLIASLTNLIAKSYSQPTIEKDV